jgi:hydroxymethylglutaryl-CoA lyase
MPIQIIECPRDAMQGFHHAISTDTKIKYLNQLIKVGFDVLDCGSFVSSKAIPQLADTKLVLQNIDSIQNQTQLLVIVANERGAEEAVSFDNVSYVGFPFSISEAFQKRNTNQGMADALVRLSNINKIAIEANKSMVVYLSMGFGNPYGEHYSVDLALEWCKKIADIGIQTISLSDTVGVAKEDDIKSLFQKCNREIKDVMFGAHFHTQYQASLRPIEVAYAAGCRRFDAALKGFGGCPFATDKLLGNLPTEILVDYIDSIYETSFIQKEEFNKAKQMASEVFV